MVRKKRLKENFYQSDIYVIVTDDFEEVNKTCNTKITDSYSAVTFQLFNEGHEVFMVFKYDSLKPKYLVHECVHAVNYVFRNSGVKPSLANDETQAYFTSWLFKQVMDYWDKLYLLKPSPDQKQEINNTI